MSERKYRQRGYQDDDSRDRDEHKSPRPRLQDRHSIPRGRGLGKPTATVFRCAVCGEKQLSGLEIGHATACFKCSAPLHSCTHCAHFDSSAPNECRKEPAEYVAAKAKRNSCPLFEPRLTQEFAQGGDSPSDAKAAFDALFNL